MADTDISNTTAKVMSAIRHYGFQSPSLPHAVERIIRESAAPAVEPVPPETETYADAPEPPEDRCGHIHCRNRAAAEPVPLTLDAETLWQSTGSRRDEKGEPVIRLVDLAALTRPEPSAQEDRR